MDLLAVQTPGRGLRDPAAEQPAAGDQPEQRTAKMVLVYVNARAVVERTTTDGGVEILLQTRDKPGQRRQLELPGGQVESYESLLAALRREVNEETGLDVVEVEGAQTCMIASGEQATVECVRPFAVYQTLEGPVDSMGVYFRCAVEGQLRPQEGESAGADWFGPDRIREMMDQDPEQFSWVDRAGLLYYLATPDAG